MRALSADPNGMSADLLGCATARERGGLAGARQYRSPGRSAAQIAAKAAHSWRQVKRDASRQRVVA